MEVKDGEGQKPLQFKISMSISKGEIFVFAKRSSMTGKITM
jgi:hypothetical protein